MKLKLSSIVASTLLTLTLVGCGSSSSSDDKKTDTSKTDTGKTDTGKTDVDKADTTKSRIAYLNAMGVSFEKDMTTLTDAWTNEDDEARTADIAFNAKSVANATGDLIQGAIDISTEVGTAKISDPIEGDTDAKTSDVTKVESQFSWNSTADFYNNIYSVKKVWDAGLKALSKKAGADVSKIDVALEDALNKIKLISDLDTDKVIDGTSVIVQEKAFRNRMSTTDGNSAILAAQKALNDGLTPALEAAQKTITSEAGVSALNGWDKGKETVKAVADKAIKATYTKLGKYSTDLKNSIENFKKNPTKENLEKARTDWKLARAQWESSEAYIVSTAPSLGAATDGNTDSWPVTSQAAIEANLKAWDGDTFTIVTTDGETKGFHTIEYLLFGDGSKLESAEDGVTRLKK